MPALVGSKGRPRDNEATRSGRKHIQRLLAPSLEVLEGILYCEGANQADRTEKRKAAQYIIDQNLGRAAFAVYGQIDVYKTELIFKAFLAGGADQLPEAERLQLAQVIDSVPGEFAQPPLCEPEATETELGQEPASQGSEEREAVGTEPFDGS